jgi:hypothetical protein
MIPCLGIGALPLPVPRFALGQVVEASIDEPFEDAMEPDRTWIKAWCKGIIIGTWWHWGYDFTLSSSLDSQWHYQVLVLEWDDSNYFNNKNEPVVLQMQEGEMS